jgi:prepilin-type N-terminal cleavage/methylation domain-containing protein
MVRRRGGGQAILPVRTDKLVGPPQGYTLLEVVVAMAVFGMFLFILAMLTVEMRAQEKRLPVNFLRHPQVIVVVSKLRRDVQDAFGPAPYPESYGEYTQSPQTLIVQSHVKETGGVQTIVWDFRTPGEVKRRAYNVGVPTDWTSRGLPPDFSSFKIDAVGIPGRPYGVHITARDAKGRLAIDQILQPRAHE